MLSDGTIRRMLGSEIIIDPFPDLDRRLQPASLDVTLGHQFLITTRSAFARQSVDPKVDSGDLLWHSLHCDPADPDAFLMIQTGQFILASTAETITLSRNVIARIEGKSSVGRLGVMIHATAGFIDPGFSGTITLEVFCVAPLPVRLYPGMPIGQLAFDWLDQPAEHPYQGKYQQQFGPTPSRYHRNWDAQTRSW